MIRVTFKLAKGQYVLSAFLFIWNTVTPFINLFFPKWILDELTGNKKWKAVLFLIVMWAVINGVVALINTALEIISTPYQDKSYFKESMHYLKMDAEMDYCKIENGSTLDEQERIGTNLPLAYFANNIIFTLLTNLFQLLGYTYILATLHPLLIVFLLAVIFFNSLMSKRRNRIDYEYQKKISKYIRRFSYLFNTLVGYSFAKEIRINNAGKWIGLKYKSETKDYMNTFSKKQNTHLKIDVTLDIIKLVQTLVLYAYSAYRVINEKITIGDFGLYIGTTTAFIESITSITDKISKMKYLSGYIDDYKAFVKNATPTYDDEYLLDVPKKETHEIEFENVSFKYPGHDKYVLKGISFKLKNGERLSVVGYNGAGKSTLIKLICRLYKPTEGRILYNEIDIETLKYEQYTNILSVVFQDFNIYSMSVRDNVVLAGNTDEKEILNAIEKSGLSEKIEKIPLGLETQLGKDFDENGIEFSGGEGQKLSCARAYYKNAPIVILDEPTASLDPISENQLYQRFNEIIGNKTTIYISHRLASVKFCDRIVVLAGGEIMESGTHNELINNKGVYFEMFTKQAEYYIENLE